MSIDDIVTDIESKANVGTDISTGGVDGIMLREVTSTITRITSSVFGVLVVIIIITIPLIVIFEICYICFPPFRYGTDKAVDKIKTSGVAKRVAEFTFRDARQAVIASETKETGRSALWLYLKIKLKSIMFIMFMIALVMLGSGTIIQFISKLLGGFFTLIKNAIYSIL